MIGLAGKHVDEANPFLLRPVTMAALRACFLISRTANLALARLSCLDNPFTLPSLLDAALDVVGAAVADVMLLSAMVVTECGTMATVSLGGFCCRTDGVMT